MCYCSHTYRIRYKYVYALVLLPYTQSLNTDHNNLTLYPHRDVGMPTALAVGNVRRSVSEYAVWPCPETHTVYCPGHLRCVLSAESIDARAHWTCTGLPGLAPNGRSMTKISKEVL